MRRGRTILKAILLLGVCYMTAITAHSHAQAGVLSIGQIQGATDESPLFNQYVSFRGVVTGQYEDQNTRGDVYYTIFVQEPPDASDGDPATSDAVAVFLGRRQPYVAVGDQVLVSGRITEFFGLTEIDDNDLLIAVEGRGLPLPPPVIIDPPADNETQREYFEALEAMRVTFADEAVVVGPTHEGCGFAVMASDVDENEMTRIVRRATEDPVGQVVPILYPSDRDCDAIPQVKTGDRITGITGPLVYNFDEFKIVLESVDNLIIEAAALPRIKPLAHPDPSRVRVVSINAENYFDDVRDSGNAGELVWTTEEVAARRMKLAHLVGDVLGCPTFVGLQEVEKVVLLEELVTELARFCGFTYAISHLESPDERGIDNALLSDPRRVTIMNVGMRQTCSPVPTDITDLSITCPPGEEPLFGRPPLQIDALIDGEAYTLFVNHFKSKRGGEIETGLERIRQAVYLNQMASHMLLADQEARIIALGDFNDTELSPVMLLLTDPTQGGVFHNALSGVPPEQRYSYIFGGVAELIDGILLSSALMTELQSADLIHVNADFPLAWRLDTSAERLAYRFSDHDIPLVELGESVVQATPTLSPTVAVIRGAGSSTPGPTQTSLPTDKPPVPTMRPSPTPFVPTAEDRVDRPWASILVGVMLIAGLSAVFLRRRR